MIDLAGRTAVVTGAARGIGAAIAGRLAALGAEVALVDLDAAALSDRVEALAETGVTVRSFTGDITDAVFDERVIRETVRELGAVDILVNNAGIIRDNRVENISEDDWDAVLSVNLKGTFLFCRAAAPAMRARRHGRIVNIVSRAWLGNYGQANYSASKGGVVSLTRTLALELARDGITVNGVAPGLIDTPMTRALPEKVRERLVRMQPTGTMGTPDDIAAAVCFLASGEAGFITGQILHVDGGKSCGLLSL